jgi:hypothetical protein
MPMLWLAGIPIEKAPFAVGDQVVWNERRVKGGILDELTSVYGPGPFIVVKTRIDPNNFSGTIQVRKGRRYVYFVRPKDLKPHIPYRSVRWWDLHYFRLV